MAKKQDYEILGIEPGATPERRRAAFRLLAKQHHPDLGGDEVRFKAVNAANAAIGANAAIEDEAPPPPPPVNPAPIVRPPAPPETWEAQMLRGMRTPPSDVGVFLTVVAAAGAVAVAVGIRR